MSIRRYATFLLGVALLLIAFTPLILAETKFFPIEQVRPGLEGVGYSVFSGTKVEVFSIKVISVVEDNFGKDKLILVKMTGKRIKEVGGLAAGMSGSPVYIHKRLLGAISYGFENADAFLALVTPIETMLKLVPDGGIAQINSGSSRFTPVVTPVVVSGMGNRAYELLSQTLDKQGLKSVYFPNVAGSGKETAQPLVAGSAIAVQMVTGDYQVAAIGTITFVDNHRFLAFGHSFSNKGNVDYLALQAYIVHTVKSPVMSFKIGIPLQPIGRVVQDRQAGIMGYLGESPELIPVTVNTTDVERKLSRTTNFRVVHDERLCRDLICSGVTDAIDQTIDRVGYGTAKVKIKLETAVLPEPIIRENMYYGKDIALSCLGDLRNLLEIMTANEFRSVGIKSIQVDIEIQSQQKTARIIKLAADKKKFKPGESFVVKALLHTYRGENITIPFEVKLPENIDSGKLSVTVHGGIKDSNLEEGDSAKKESFKIDYKNVNSLTKLLENYLNNPGNHQVVVEYQVDSKAVNTGEDEKELQTEQLKSNTQYYILGEAQLTIEIIQ